jgi:hypothetical protein
MGQIVGFLRAVIRNWVAMAGGVAAIAFLSVWASMGHAVAPWIAGMIGIVAALAACFPAWKHQAGRAEQAETKMAEMSGRPELALRCMPVKSQKMDAQDWSAMGAETIYQFALRNSSSIQAVNVTIDDIVVAAPGGTRSSVVFERVSSVSSGQEHAVPFRIDGMGPFLNRDICNCLGQAGGTETGSTVRVPLNLRFSNRDGSRWIQKHDLAYSFPSSLTIEYRGIERDHS